MADPYVHALIPATRLQDPDAFTAAQGAAYGLSGQEREAAFSNLLRDTRLTDGVTLEDAVLDQAVLAESEGTTGLEPQRVAAAHEVSRMVLDVTIDRATSEIGGVYQRVQESGPTPGAVARKQRSLARIPSGYPGNYLSGGVDRSRSLPGAGVVKVA